MAMDDGQRAVALFWLTRRLYRRRRSRYNMNYVCVLHERRADANKIVREIRFDFFFLTPVIKNRARMRTETP